MKIFFARSFNDFGTEYEKLCIDTINQIWNNYNCTIIEFPNIPNIPIFGRALYLWEKEYFFPLIDQSDIIIAMPIWNAKYKKYRGKFGGGVIIEIAYGLIIGKKTVGLIENKARDIKWEDLEEYKKNKNINITLKLLREDYKNRVD